MRYNQSSSLRLGSGEAVHLNPRRRTAVLVDRYPLWLEALEQVVARAGIAVAGSASDPLEALELVGRHQPDLLVGEVHGLDSRLDGPAFVSAARTGSQNLRVVVVSGSEDAEDMRLARDAGVSAYVFKTARPGELVDAIRRVFDPASAVAADGNSAVGLTKRELEILRLVAEGYSNARLARMLWVTEQTVKFHLSNIYRKLDVANRTEASRWAQVHNLLPPRPDDTTLSVY